MSPHSSFRIHHSPFRSPRRGVVLIVVTVAILMVSLAGLSFMVMMSTEHKAVHAHGDGLHLAALVDSGQQLLAALAELPPERRRQAGGLIDNPELFRGNLVFVDEETGYHGRFSVVAPNVENDEITGMRFGAEDESARLNLGLLLQWESQQPGAARDALMNLPGMTEAIADAMLDWMDGDGQPRQFGAEGDYYAGLSVPYAPRNAVPCSLEELLLVRGVTRELLLGGDANFNHQLEPEESQAAAAGLGSFQSGAPLRWASMLTVHSAERNVSQDGQARVNLNQPDLRKLHKELAARIDPEWARFIIWYRQLGPYQGADGPDEGEDATEGEYGVGESPRHKTPQQPKQATRAAKEAVGVRGPRSAGGLDFSQPARFRLDTVLDLVGARVQVPGPPGRPARVARSPLANDSAMMREDLPVLLDHATVTAAKVIVGRINVSQAPRAVLLGVPGLDGALVEQIVTARGSSRPGDDPNRRHPTWLLTEGIVDLAQMKRLMPYLNCGGEVFRAQIVGFCDELRATARVEVVIDATLTPPRPVYWKDLRMLGAGYSLAALGAQPPRKS